VSVALLWYFRPCSNAWVAFRDPRERREASALQMEPELPQQTRFELH
jgi:hypothetical protein